MDKDMAQRPAQPVLFPRLRVLGQECYISVGRAIYNRLNGAEELIGLRTQIAMIHIFDYICKSNLALND